MVRKSINFAMLSTGGDARADILRRTAIIAGQSAKAAMKRVAPPWRTEESVVDLQTTISNLAFGTDAFEVFERFGPILVEYSERCKSQ